MVKFCIWSEQEILELFALKQRFPYSHFDSIEEEFIDNGLEQFFNEISLDTLKQHCAVLHLDNTDTADGLVLFHIFFLLPSSPFLFSLVIEFHVTLVNTQD